jgi:hypothetical protein
MISTQRNQTDSPLLRLPAELRASIYEYIFYGLTIQFHGDTFRNRQLVYKGPVALRQTCRQLRHESYSTFFKCTKFNFDVYWEIDGMAELAGTNTWSSIQSIDLGGGVIDYIKNLSRLTPAARDNVLRSMSIPGLSGLQHVHMAAPQPDDAGDDLDTIKDRICFIFQKESLEFHLQK